MNLLDYSFSKEDKLFLIGLLSVKGVGRSTAKKIIFHLKKHEHKTTDFWVNKVDILKKCNLKLSTINSIKKSIFEQNIYSLLEKLKRDSIRVVVFWEGEYPQLLLQTEDFPLLLFIKGNVNLLQKKAIAVVGTRRVTSYGRMVTKKLVSELVVYDYTIISGSMYGVDQVAHQATLDSRGNTIAVLGYGFDQVPAYMQKFQNQIIGKGGCVITEYYPKISANKGTFPERNRIVAGMSLGVLVTEAALKSGTHITANCALDAGRDVFAVPGSILNPYSKGTKYLLNQGAILVTSGQDVVAELKKIVKIPLSEGKYNTVAQVDSFLDGLGLEEFQKKVVREILFLPQSVDQLAEKTGFSIKELLRILGMLELENILKNEAGVWHCVLSYSGHA